MAQSWILSYMQPRTHTWRQSQGLTWDLGHNHPLQQHSFLQHKHINYCSVPQSCLTLCDPMDCSTPGFPVLHYLPEFAQIHVWWCHPTISSSVTTFSSCLQSFPASGSFPVSQPFIPKWPKDWNFSIYPSSEYSGLISFRIDWFDLIFLWKGGREQGVLFSWGFTGICHRENAATSRNGVEENLWWG